MTSSDLSAVTIASRIVSYRSPQRDYPRQMVAFILALLS